jgi:hypothetical protein
MLNNHKSITMLFTIGLFITGLVCFVLLYLSISFFDKI